MQILPAKQLGKHVSSLEAPLLHWFEDINLKKFFSLTLDLWHLHTGSTMVLAPVPAYDSNLAKPSPDISCYRDFVFVIVDPQV